MEILLAFLFNLKDAFQVSSLLLGITVIIGFFVWSASKDELEKDDEKKLKGIAFRILRVSIPLFLVFMLLGNIPDMNDIWKVRIGLIKYRLANQENLSKASETIERIGKKLECKYLGCDEKK